MTGVTSAVLLLPLLTAASPPPATVALLVTEPGELSATATAKPNVLKFEPLFGIAVVLVQVIVCPEAVQLQLAAFAPFKVTAPAAIVKPTGRVSVTVIVPTVETVPELVTVKL
jgi:hypothetical protein